MDRTTGRDVPPISPQMTPARAFALMLETACEQFEVLQFMLRKEIKVISHGSTDPWKRVKLMRAPSCIRMALAKSFVANVIRARRICERQSQHLAIERVERRLFLSSTSGVKTVRDVNEHGYDHNTKSPRMLHFNRGGFQDETSLHIGGSEEILMGPLNLFDVYRSVARMRDLAGFLARPQQI
jgi:hypothetical protein